MTREEAKELLPIIKAFAEGKTIEIHERNGWMDMITENPAFDSGPSCYRIKPEHKYRPFKTQEECWNEMLKHQPFGWLKSKETGSYRNISEVAYSEGYGVPITSYTYEPFISSSKTVYINYTFADGTPFGIMEG